MCLFYRNCVVIMKKIRYKRGQAIFEQTVVILTAIGAAALMTTMIKRGLQARIHDANKYMHNIVNAAPFNGNLAFQYEPYFAYSEAQITQNSKDTRTVVENETKHSINEETNVFSKSVQLPPRDANRNREQNGY